MLPMNKTPPVSPAGMDLGLGDQLKNQLNAELDERRKKALRTTSPAANALLGTPASLGAGV